MRENPKQNYQYKIKIGVKLSIVTLSFFFAFLDIFKQPIHYSKQVIYLK